MNIHKLFSHRVHQLPCCQARVPFLDRQFMEVQHLDDDSCAFIMLDPNATKEKWKKQTVRFCGKTVRFVWVLGGSRYCSFPRLRFLASSCQIDACDQLVFELIDQSTSRMIDAAQCQTDLCTGWHCDSMGYPKVQIHQFRGWVGKALWISS